MKDLLEKISSYNIFNYLLPGILFTCVSKYFTDYNFIQENILIGLFLYYFIGMVISRIGSLFLEPVLKKVGFLKFVEYKKFIVASEKDDKIDLLSQVNNTYRTITALFISLLLLKGYNYFQISWHISEPLSLLLLIIFIFLLFLFSYRKQANYVAKRVNAA